MGTARFSSLCLCTGEILSCTSLLEVLDLSWNGGVGGAALQGMLGKLGPSLLELRLVSCQLTAADAAVLGTACLRQQSKDTSVSYISHHPAAELLSCVCLIRKRRFCAPQALCAGRLL